VYPTHDGPTCQRHGVQYSALETCPQCVDDPGPLPDADIDEPLSPAPDGCLSSQDIERAFVNDARRLNGLIRRLVTYTPSPGAAAKDIPALDYHVANTVAKLFDTRTKCLRAAADCARSREDEEIVRRREKRQREMRGAPK
jgi:hypothetical protein